MKRRAFLVGLLGTAVAPFANAMPIIPPVPFFGPDILPSTGDYETVPVWMRYLEEGTSEILWDKPTEPGWTPCEALITARKKLPNGAVWSTYTITNTMTEVGVTK